MLSGAISRRLVRSGRKTCGTRFVLHPKYESKYVRVVDALILLVSKIPLFQWYLNNIIRLVRTKFQWLRDASNCMEDTCLKTFCNKSSSVTTDTNHWPWISSLTYACLNWSVQPWIPLEPHGVDSPVTDAVRSKMIASATTQIPFKLGPYVYNFVLSVSLALCCSDSHSRDI